MKTSLVCLMALATVMGLPDVSGTRVCTPNALFDLQCNKCVCSADGSTYACTKMFCPMTKSALPVCIPNSFFKEDCNHCACSADGQFKSCTRMMCVKTMQESHTVNEIPETRVCEPNSHFKDYCNDCFCSADGLRVACTRMACDKNIFNKDGTLRSINIEENKEPKEQICEPNSSFKDYCNHCSCSNDGTQKVCTKMYCDKAIFNPDGSLKVDVRQGKDVDEEEHNEHQLPEADVAENVECEPNSEFREYCNKCFCSTDGKSKACTKMFCDPEIFNKNGTVKTFSAFTAINHEAVPMRFAASVAQKTKDMVCEPGKPFKNFCNTCQCSDDGKEFSCTRMYCDPEIFNEDGSPKQLPIVKSIKWGKPICGPGRVYKDYCNTCRCSADGLSEACTLVECDKNIFNKDGSLKQQQQQQQEEEEEKEEEEPAQNNSERICEPNKIFKDYCNTCKCSPDGRSKACTLIECNKDIFNQDGTFKTKRDEQQEGSSRMAEMRRMCAGQKPGFSFKDDCNTCRCLPSGQIACTLIACPSQRSST